MKLNDLKDLRLVGYPGLTDYVLRDLPYSSSCRKDVVIVGHARPRPLPHRAHQEPGSNEEIAEKTKADAMKLFEQEMEK